MPGGADSNFCLRWNEFEANVSASFRTIRADRDFFDVTLACDASQGRTLQAHKVILSACSTFFKEMLKQQQKAAAVNPASASAMPFIYLRGVKYKDLSALLDFMYHGEVNIAQEELAGFLAVAEDLHIKGLTQGNVSKDLAGSAGTSGTGKRGRGRAPGSAAKRARTSNVTNVTIEDDLNSSGIKNEPLLDPATGASADGAGAADAEAFETSTETFVEGYGDETTTYTYDETVGTEAIAVETSEEPADASATDPNADKGKRRFPSLIRYFKLPRGRSC